MINKSLIWICLIISIVSLVSISTLADTTYPNLGGEDTDYQRGLGNWNNELDLDIVTSVPKTIGTQTMYPIVDDLNNNGDLEVILMDGDTIRVYENDTLNVIGTASYDFGTAGYTSNIITYDINGDSNKEVIFFDNTNEHLIILSYDGYNFSVNKVDYSPLISFVGGETVLGCKGVNDCALVYTVSDLSGTGTAREIFILGFNSSAEISTNILLIDNHAGFSSFHGNLCLPKFKHIGNYDDNFIFSYAHVSASTGDRAGMVKKVTKTGSTLSVSATIERASTTVLSSGGAFTCTSGDYGKYITSPLIADITTAFGGDEMVFGLGYDTDEFKMYSYKNDGTFLDDYPEVGQANGEIFSNVMLFNAFEDTGNIDFCVAGYSISPDELNLLCGSVETSGVQTREYEFSDISAIFNITDSYQNYNALSHAVQYSDTLTDGTKNLNELVNAYGVFSLDTSGTNSLTREWNNPKGDSVIIPTDINQIGLEQLLILTDTNLFLMLDGSVNTGGQITRVEISPCINAVWAINATVSIQVEVTDTNNGNDDVNSYVSLYDNTIFEINESSENASSGNTFGYIFTANETIANGLLTIEGRDVENPNDVDSIPLSFTVASQGMNFGDCTTILEFDLLESGVNASIVADGIDENNVITTGITEIDELFGFGLGNGLLYMIFMAIIAITIWTTNTGSNGSEKLGVIAIVQVILIIIGALLGFISTGIIITIVVVGIVGIGLWMRNMFTGQNGG